MGLSRFDHHASLNGKNWRKALVWVIAELLVIKLLAILAMKLLFFSSPAHDLTARDVDARLFPAASGRAPITTITEKSHD